MKTFDSWAWVEYFRGSRSGETVRAILESDEVLSTPSVSLAELKLKYLAERRDPSERLQFIKSRTSIVPVDVFEWYLKPGAKGEGKDKVLEQGGQEWQVFRTDKCDPLRESDCIDCMACETACPTLAIKITPSAS